MMNNVKDLAHLCSLEDDYFDYFEHLGGPAAFMSYNGLQLYLESRQDPEWVKSRIQINSIGEHASLLVNTCKLDNRVKHPLLVLVLYKDLKITPYNS